MGAATVPQGVRIRLREDGLLDDGLVCPRPLTAAPAEWLSQLAERSSWMVRPATIYLASRAAVLLAAGVAVMRMPNLTLANALLRWDSGWYLLIAKAGYLHTIPKLDGQVLPNTFAFFPLFPLSIRQVMLLTGLSPTLSGLVLSSAFGLLAALAVWLLARDLWGAAAAYRACALFCFFPGSFVFSLVYAEGLMIALAAGCLLALGRRRWVLAGVLAALATATRPNAIALGAACAWVAVLAVHRRREWRSLLAPALAPVGILAYFGYLWIQTGSTTVWFATENQGWHEGFDLTATWNRISAFVTHPSTNLNNAVGLACLVFVVIAVIVLLRCRLPGEFAAYAAVVIGLTLVSKLYGTTPRFVITAFPLLMVLGYRLRGAAFFAALAASATAMGWVMVMTASSLALTP